MILGEEELMPEKLFGNLAHIYIYRIGCCVLCPLAYSYRRPLDVRCIRSLSVGEVVTLPVHYNDVIMGAIASRITSFTIVYSTVYSDADQRKHQSSASLAFVRGIHRGPVNSPHKWPVTRKMFPFDDVIMSYPLSDRTIRYIALPVRQSIKIHWSPTN